MTIQINPEQERVIGEAIEAGLIHTAADAIEMGVKAIRQRRGTASDISIPDARNLADLFATCPFAGLNFDFERDSDTGREVKL